MMTSDIKAADAAVRTYAKQLDDDFHGWDLWRTAIGAWCVKVTTRDGRTETFSRDGLLEALQAAALWVPLPAVPRPPTVYSVEDYHPYKHAAGRWRVMRDGGDEYVEFKTKKAAEDWIVKHTLRLVEAKDAWQAQYGWVLHATEGVEFVWEGSQL